MLPEDVRRGASRKALDPQPADPAELVEAASERGTVALTPSHTHHRSEGG